MAVFQSIRRLFTEQQSELRPVVPAPASQYFIRPVTQKNLNEIAQLNLRCFRKGENYSKHTFNYLLNEPRAVSYKAENAEGSIAGFVFVIVNSDGAAHITTLGVAPEHRRRGIAKRLLRHLESSLRAKSVSTVMLEVRVSNVQAQELYRQAGYAIVQRVAQYYNNGEDGFLMIKSLV